MDSLLIQSWALYALSLSIVFARLVFRRIMLKAFKNLQSDDWIMVFLMLPVTVFVVLTVAIGKASSPKQSTYLYILEELQIVIVWLVKACLLVLYWRIFSVAFSIVRRRYVQAVSTVCVLSFIITQTSLLSLCHPTHADKVQCPAYYSYTIVSLTFSTLTIVLIMVIPIPFIPTPRRLLLGVLMVTSISIMILGILARYYILTAPESQTYLFYYVYEITLLIVFANLPFLTSLVVTSTPARLREFGRNLSLSCEAVHMPLSTWPRSRRVSVHDAKSPPLRMNPLSSMAKVISGGTEKRESTVFIPVVRPESAKSRTGARPRSGEGWPLPS
ncbi:hypothetical protein SVAN01_04423 [Stagonosporopsis vannaccii]|nr:hypothetical protein SVAN01_04423 [Stagonosporopsis vannaccii]